MSIMQFSPLQVDAGFTRVSPIFRNLPDSERVSELLPQVDVNEEEGLYFVNRDDSAIALFKVFILNFLNRRNSGAGFGHQVGLIDSMHGMGKTSFCNNFLALIEKIRLVDGLETENEIECYAELKAARTLIVILSQGQLIGSTAINEELQESIRYALTHRIFESTTNIPNPATLGTMLSWVSRKTPLVLVLDRIGAAFIDKSKTVFEQRQCFLEFIKGTCALLLNIPRIYLVLSGRAPFLAHVGLRPYGDFEGMRFNIVRINLNPIRTDYIRLILMNTFRYGERISELIANHPDRTRQSIEDFAEKLYDATNGHPRSITQILSDFRLDPTCLQGAPFYLVEVLKFVELYPDDLKVLLKHHFDQTIVDLSVKSKADGPQPATYQYLASRIHAGFGHNIESTRICIPPFVSRFLEKMFLPLGDFLFRWRKRDVELAYDKGRNFDWAICKWFESVFKTPGLMGDVMKGFLPPESICSRIPLEIKKIHVSANQCENGYIEGIGLKPWAVELVKMNLGDIFVPAPLSSSPDFIFLTRLENEIPKIVIGVTVKPLTLLKEEIEKFNRLVYELNQLNSSYQGVLLICSTMPHSDVRLSSSESCLHNPGVENVEVVLINLESPEMRRRFFEISSCFQEQHAMIIEDMIESETSRSTDSP